MVILSKKFFNRSAEKVARDLLGKILCIKRGNNILRGMIIETEAYVGPQDKASHAYKGKTKRNAPMFGPSGVWYVYFVYGFHWMLNIVTGAQNFPAAVLIRGVKVIKPLRFKKISSKKSFFINKIKMMDGQILNGPAKVTKFFGIDKRFNGKEAIPKNFLWLEENRQLKNKKFRIERLPRVGVDYAGRIWSKKPLRFKIKMLK